MTAKQENILKTALNLFAKEGYDGISTSRIAAEAGVSEALIFRHFGSKEALLEAILNQGYERVLVIYNQLLEIKDSREFLGKIIGLPFAIPREDYDYWRLSYALKWQTNRYAHAINSTMREGLEAAFKKLGYKKPEAEAELIFIYLDGCATALLLHEPDNKKDILNAMLEKYKV